VIVELASLETDVVVALKVAVVAAAATVTEAGTLSMGLVLVSVTFAPPAGAAEGSATVQVLELFGPRLAVLHDKPEGGAGVVGTTNLIVTLLEVPL
jgi:hypothetical protein